MTDVELLVYFCHFILGLRLKVCASIIIFVCLFFSFQKTKFYPTPKTSHDVF